MLDLQFFSSFEPACATDQWFKIFLNLVKFSLTSYSIFSGNITALSQSPSSMILCWVNLPAVSFCGESCDLSSPMKFSTCFFSLHNSSLPGPLSNGLKYFRVWLRFCRVIRVFRDWLRAVSYCAESVSPKYDTVLSQSPRCMILCWFNLP